MKLPWLLFLLVSLPNLVLAQESLVFRAKKIQASPDLVYQPGEILVRESKIIRIGESITKPKNHKFVDWSEFEIYPGLISPGSSLGLAEINAIRPTRDEREVGTHTPEIEAWTAVNPDSELIPVARANGITHSLIVPMGGTISGVSGLITLDGWGIEEMAIVQKVALHIWWPGQGLSIPNHNSEGNQLKNKRKSESKTSRILMSFSIRQRLIKEAGLLHPKVKPI